MGCREEAGFRIEGEVRELSRERIYDFDEQVEGNGI
jgi:hypothetical protein